MDFLALVNGQQASIIHLDDQGHVTVEPIDFLKGHVLLGWAVADLDHIVTCEQSASKEGEMEFRFYDHKALVQTFRMMSTTSTGNFYGPWMMFLNPEKHYLFVSTPVDDLLYRFDLKTGERTEVKIGSETPGELRIQDDLTPLWDAKQGKPIVEMRVTFPEVSKRYSFLTRMDPETFSFKDRVIEADNTWIYQLLCYDPESNNVVFYGQVGGAMPQWGTAGFYTMPLDTGRPKLLMKDYGVIPMLSGSGPTNSMATINKRYAITTRSLHSGPYAVIDPHTYLLDLQTHGAQMLDMPYVAWPISQAGLHVDR